MEKTKQTLRERVYAISSLRRHLTERREVTDSPAARNKAKCLEQNCTFSGRNAIALSDHLVEVHQMIIETQELQFSSLNDFVSWKSGIEKEVGNTYVKVYGHVSKSCYNCKPSGCYARRTRPAPKSRKKSSSNRSYCTSRIMATRNGEDGQVTVNFIKTHYGHGVDDDTVVDLESSSPLEMAGSVCKAEIVYLHNDVATEQPECGGTAETSPGKSFEEKQEELVEVLNEIARVACSSSENFTDVALSELRFSLNNFKKMYAAEGGPTSSY